MATGQALSTWQCALRVEAGTGSQGPPGFDSLGGLQRIYSQRSGHLLAMASQTPPRLSFSICTMGIKFIYISGLLEELKERSDPQSITQIPGGQMCFRILNIFWIFKTEYGGNTTYFVSLQPNLGQGPVIKCINISAGKLMNIHSPWDK